MTQFSMIYVFCEVCEKNLYILNEYKTIQLKKISRYERKHVLNSYKADFEFSLVFDIIMIYL